MTMMFHFISMIVVLVTHAAASESADGRRVLLNHKGDAFVKHNMQHCSDTDWSMIDQILIESVQVESHDHHRYLTVEEKRTLQSMYCKRECAHMVPGRCTVPGCSGMSMVIEGDNPPEKEYPVPVNGTEPGTDSVNGTELMSGMDLVNGSEQVKGPEPATGAQSLNGLVRHLTVDEERTLQSLTCKRDCVHIVGGKCYLPGCIGMSTEVVNQPGKEETPQQLNGTQPVNGSVRHRFLRSRDKDSSSLQRGKRAHVVEEEKQESATTTLTPIEPCSAALINFVNIKLDTLIQENAISSTCQAALKEHRHVSCYRHHEMDSQLDTAL
jgi:hypothetical protein